MLCRNKMAAYSGPDLMRGMLSFLFAPKSVALRQARADDAEALAAIHREGGFAVAWAKSEFEQLLVDQSVVTDVIGSSRGGRNIFGFIMSRRAADEAEILTIAVRRRYRRSGFGKKMLQHHMARLVSFGVNALFLEVEDGNRPAHILYAKRGFAEVGRRNAYYKKPDGSTAAAIVMRRGLGAQ